MKRTIEPPSSTERILDLGRLDGLFASVFGGACTGDPQAVAAALQIMA
jgi:hypothetical protein